MTPIQFLYDIVTAAMGVVLAFFALSALGLVRVSERFQTEKGAGGGSSKAHPRAPSSAPSREGSREGSRLEKYPPEPPQAAAPQEVSAEPASADTSIDTWPSDDEAFARSARVAVLKTGLTGPDADRMYAAIMQGVAQARARGEKEGVLAINLTPGAFMEKVEIRHLPKDMTRNTTSPLHPVSYAGSVFLGDGSGDKPVS